MSTNTHIRNDEEETNSRLGCVKQYRDIDQDQDHTHTIPKIAKVSIDPSIIQERVL